MEGKRDLYLIVLIINKRVNYKLVRSSQVSCLPPSFSLTRKGEGA